METSRSNMFPVHENIQLTSKMQGSSLQMLQLASKMEGSSCKRLQTACEKRSSNYKRLHIECKRKMLALKSGARHSKMKGSSSNMLQMACKIASFFSSQIPQITWKIGAASNPKKKIQKHIPCTISYLFSKFKHYAKDCKDQCTKSIHRKRTDRL